MNWRKFFRRGLTVIFILVSLFTAVVVCAAIQIFDGTGQYIMSDDGNRELGKKRAQQRAELDAQKKAGVYLKTFSRSVNSELTDDEISAVTNNIIKVSDVKIVPVPFETNGEAGLMYRATLKASIDPEGIYDFIKRDDKEKVTIVQQNNGLQDAIAKNDTLIEDLKEQYKRATSQSERDSIIKQMNEADKRFLAIQKVEKGLKLRYKSLHKDDELACYNQAIELDPTYAEAYFYRGKCHIRYSFRLTGPTSDAKENSALAIADFSKAIELKPDYIKAYNERAMIYRLSSKYEQAIADYSKIIEIKPDDYRAYKERGFVYYAELHDYQRAIADYSKVIELEPLKHDGYSWRANVYEKMKNYKVAIADYSKAIELDPDSTLLYKYRGELYFKLKDYSRAIADSTKAIEFKLGVRHLKDKDPKTWSVMDKGHICSVYENRAKSYENLGDYDKAIDDYSKIIEIAPLGNGIGSWSKKDYAGVYNNRGLCYQKVGDEAKAQADFARAKELGYKG